MFNTTYTMYKNKIQQARKNRATIFVGDCLLTKYSEFVGD